MSRKAEQASHSKGSMKFVERPHTAARAMCSGSVKPLDLTTDLLHKICTGQNVFKKGTEKELTDHVAKCAHHLYAWLPSLVIRTLYFSAYTNPSKEIFLC
jgi:hypothetical protein